LLNFHKPLPLLKGLNTRLKIIIIIDLKKQYAALIYNRDKIHEIDDNELQLTINVQLFLEMLLLEIRGKTISFASYIKKIKEQRFRDLQEEIATLEINQLLELSYWYNF
jgi:hypothetical protein